MDLSIIIPSYNTKNLLDRCLSSVYQSLKGSKMSFEVIVVDNASIDGSRELLSKKYPRTLKILNKNNLGYGKANNQGILEAKGNYVLLLNSDIEVFDDAIGDLYDFASNNPKTFVGGKLFNQDGSPQSSCGPTYTLPVIALMLFCKGDWLGMTRYSPDQIRRVDWISGACLMGRKSAFIDVGLFDEHIFMYMEEIDLLYRAKEKRYAVKFFPGAHFIHTGAASSGNRKEPVANIYRGILYFYKKHRSIMELRIVGYMLRAKALLAIAIGKLTGNVSLIDTYEQALQLV